MKNSETIIAWKLGHFDEEVKECELEQMGIDRLEGKFNVTKK